VTLDEVIAARMPAGTMVYYCPFADWVHPQAPMTTEEIAASFSRSVAEVLGERLAEAEGAIKAHLETHTLLEWLTRCQHLEGQVATANTRAGEIVQHAPAILSALHLALANAEGPELARPYREALDATGWDKRL